MTDPPNQNPNTPDTSGNEPTMPTGSSGAADASGPMFEQPHSVPDGIPERIGPYRVLHLIKESGMGAVYAAIQEGQDKLRQRVAIKVVRRAVEREDVMQRFELEKQILSSLDHPNIARFIDAGRTSDGRPYFVMELIQGQQLDHFCDANNLSVRQRLELFLKVCAAVNYAHTNLVVHRDLKPGNILVTPSGEPKLLDFGIAKLLNPSMARVEIVTGPMDVLLTPEYASPEQVRGDPISTLTDVYSLGVLLYELLTGRRPHRIRTRLHEEIERLVCNTDPVRPSTRLSEVEKESPDQKPKGTGTLEEIAAHRNTKPSSLRKQISGELDDIVMMALARAPLQRYPSADMLSEDLRNYLGGETIIARRHRRTLGRHLREIGRKHPAKASAAVAAVLALAMGLSIAVVQWRGAVAARDFAKAAKVEAEEARNEAQSSRDTTDEVLRVLTKTTDNLINKIHKEIVPLAGSQSVRESLLTAIRDVTEEIGRAVGESQAQQEKLAETYEYLATTAADTRSANAGDLEKARNFQAKARDIRAALYADNSNDVALSDALAVSEIRMADLALLEGANGEANSGFQRALALLEPHDAPTINRIQQRAQIASCLNHIATDQIDQGRFDDARVNINRANDLRRAGLSLTRSVGVRRNISVGITHLGDWYFRQGQFDEAIGQYQQAIAMQRTIVSEKPDATRYRRNLTNSLGLLSMSLTAKGEAVLALEAAGESVSIIDGALADHNKVSNEADARLQEARVKSLLRQGDALRSLGRTDEARAIFSTALNESQAMVRSSPGIVKYVELQREAQNSLNTLPR